MEIILIFLIIVLALCMLFQEYKLNKLKRDYMSLKKAYCIHYVMDHFIDNWKKVATNYCKDVNIDNVDEDDIRDWAIKLLYDRKDFMEFFQCTIYQQMIDYIEQKYKEDTDENNNITEFDGYYILPDHGKKMNKKYTKYINKED